MFRRDSGEAMSTFTYWDAHSQRYASVTAQAKKAVPSETIPSRPVPSEISVPSDVYQALVAGSTPDALPLAV